MGGGPREPGTPLVYSRGARTTPIPPPPSLQQTVVNKLLSHTTSLSVEWQNTQLLHTLPERRPGQLGSS